MCQNEKINMALILSKKENLIGGLRRIASDIIIESIFLLKNPIDFDVSIHETRKNVKKIRAILRLLKNNIDIQAYLNLNIEFRDSGRKLSSLRDAEALLETLDKIKTKKNTSQISIENTRIQLLQYKEKITSEFLSNYDIALIIENFENLEKSFVNLEFFGKDNLVFNSGLQNIYTNCINLMKNCRKDGSDIDFHEWRKQVKYLWNSIMFFQKIWNPVLAAYSDEIHKLSDYLGDMHDLTVLYKMIVNNQIELAADDQERMLELIDNLRDKLKKSSFSLGFKLFIDKPSVFSKRLNKWWRHYSEI
jgi:CHAD domain-containing protein